jgi:hypothetical protein
VDRLDVTATASGGTARNGLPVSAEVSETTANGISDSVDVEWTASSGISYPVHLPTGSTTTQPYLFTSPGLNELQKTVVRQIGQ